MSYRTRSAHRRPCTGWLSRDHRSGSRTKFVRPVAILASFVALAAMATPVAGASPAPASSAPTTPQKILTSHLSATPTLAWQENTSSTIAESSPTPANFGTEGTAILVGDYSGHVYAFNSASGSQMPGWPVATEAQVNSAVTVANIDGGGTPDLFVGSGTATSYNLSSNRGALYSFNAAGGLRWKQVEPTPMAIGQPPAPDSPVQSTPVVGNFVPGGGPDVYAGTLGLQSWAYNETGNPLPGWPYYQNDTIYSSPALADLNGSGTSQIIVGGDASGPPTSAQGGRLRVLNGSGQVEWQYNTDEMIRSSPAIGDVDGSGQPEIVFGTGNYFYDYNQANGLPEPQDSTKIFVLNSNGTLHCEKNLGQITFGSPALADIEGNGQLDIVIGTELNNQGEIWALDGNCNTLPGWPVASPGGAILGGITTANLTGNPNGAQDLLVPTGAGVYAYQGTTGQLLFTLNVGAGISYQNSPLITDEGGGNLAIYLAGTYANTTTGVVSKFEIHTGGSLGSLAWPMFHLNPMHTGSWTSPPLTSITSMAPTKTGQGYWMNAPNGAVYPFGSAAYEGSAGEIALAEPTIGMASTPDGGGYWLVSPDGGIFSFGDAHFYGSTGAMVLNKPIVGMASTPDGGGYWLVASDGGIFSFGDAHFYGSTGAMVLNKPIVGMASTPDGGGYWLVASDGGIFSFGDAHFYGSTGAMVLNKPIVGMASTPDGGGYWLVASDGGIFSFGDAHFYGSTGAMVLNKPIVGMASTPDGGGYWLVASDGGIFSFGDAHFYGSMGTLPSPG